MTTVIFKGSVHRVGGQQKYGEFRIHSSIQFIRGENRLSAGTIIFQDESECKKFSDVCIDAWCASMRAEDRSFKTAIEPEPGTPVYGKEGEEINYIVETDKLYKAYTATEHLPVLPPYARK